MKNSQKIKDTILFVIGGMAGVTLSELLWLAATGDPGVLTRFVLGLFGG